MGVTVCSDHPVPKVQTAEELKVRLAETGATIAVARRALDEGKIIDPF